jgi:RimJ/RimL family protein N-acetyltransferase
MMEYLDIKLKSIAKSDHRFLYQHLKERNPSANISHKKMPTYAEHVGFVMSRPYSKWYIIINKNKKIGTIYLTKQNEIGIFIKNKVQGKLIGQRVLKLLMEKNPRKRYLANVSPKNKKSISFFKKNGFKLIQYTFELE